MTARELRQKYIKFFLKLGHKEIPNVSLVPENDPSALFISAGMHPLTPYLLGEPHPLGKRLINCQRCLRTGDLNAVGDTFHNTFFEMLGNWSLGDYFKKEMIPWSLEFLTKELGFKQERLSVTVFKGDADAPYDQEAEKVWQKVGIPKRRIFALPKKDNWWGPVGETGPCGPDSEIFYDIGKKKCSSDCRPGCDCGKYFELWNLVFMQYEKTGKGEYRPLSQKNVDTGMGVERTTAILQGKDDVYQTELFMPIIEKIEGITGQKYETNKKSMRIIADHLRAATFVIADGVEPANVDRGYILRRLIRRAIDQAEVIDYSKSLQSILEAIINIYQKEYPQLETNRDKVYKTIKKEMVRYCQAIQKSKRILPDQKKISGEEAFGFYATHGTAPYQLEKQGYEFDQKEFDKAFKKHQKLSRAGVQKKFAGGLADKSKKAIKFHTATHLLHQALRDILGEHVKQVGSNITSERIRFDFTHPEKLTEEQIRKVEKIVNQKIRQNLPVKMKIMFLEEAKKVGALALFEKKYGEKVKVYFIGDYSTEVCAGPHISSTREISNVKIIKEESAGAGKRRIYVVTA
ncbi:alanine--tRNA ligase [Candidatus Microgenomates bacterium]|nr:alanine--tRNA ligase [Candidatus Microgenomates bacterium]